ncbi:hypothetical protein BDP27DRAFT_1317523 [Rhodocollybia butyracea]|uniref:Uncharacterized protein n=1 Tax=Rhodocollybia butyracea TaxID=206335 RepID=A0A9P5P4F2_9AGAR|nr:hypothetical protein BDP27DRAFT_1344925 [Rhodocollybia butyracea]KAF9074232.1 hypothetical protein BDP27DRAFT_1317523 [Rhodocollybia butyracea]
MVNFLISKMIICLSVFFQAIGKYLVLRWLMKWCRCCLVVLILVELIMYFFARVF